MLLKGIRIVFFFLLPLSVMSQTITCTIRDNDSRDVFSANIFFKEQKTLETKEFTFAENGSFRYKLTKNYDSLLVEFRALGYITKKITIGKPLKGYQYNYNIILESDSTDILDEIIIIGKKEPFFLKKDTVTFDVSKYSDGKERKIYEIIEKLPGIDVDKNSGEIRYKGKSIETVTLDGDNLFGANYTLGTKNINVDMVEQIEAIDNYAENPLLKGIEQGGKVSLNLKLKKGKTDFSGDINLGVGSLKNIGQAHDLSSVLLGINKSYKSFASFSYNNVGNNQTPFDYFGFNFNIEQQKEQSYFAEKIIPETRFSNLLEDRRSNINNQFFGNYNAIFKINPKLSIKTNLYFLQDRIATNQLFRNDFQINSVSFTTSDNTFIKKKPLQYRGDIQVKYNTSKTSLLEYNLKLRQENIETLTTVIQNQIDEFSTFLNSEDFYLKQDLLWTKKLSNKKALQFFLFHSFNNLPQTFNITPSLFDINALNDNQKSEFQRTVFEGKATYLGSSKKDKYTFSVGANLNDSPFVSRLFNLEETISKNNFDYVKSSIYNTGVYNFNKGKWQISPSYSVRFLNQSLKQNLENQITNQGNLIFEPKLEINYIISSTSFISSNLSYNQDTNAESYFFLNQVLLDNRTLINNIPNLKLQKNQVFSFLYFVNDLYNQFQLNANVTFVKSEGNFFTNQNITENITQIEYFFLPQNNSNFNSSLKISKYFSVIKSKIQLKTNYAISNYKNIVNSSDLRQNRSQFLSNSFFWKTAFDLPINFENTFTYNYSNSKSENQLAFINKSLQNTFNVVIKPFNRWLLVLSSDYYLPNTKQITQDFLFLDANLKYQPKSKKWHAGFVIRNLSNEVNFEQIQTSDVAISVFRNNLLPSSFLLNWSYTF